jgi:outer membrane protein assembly factor BamB
VESAWGPTLAQRGAGAAPNAIAAGWRSARMDPQNTAYVTGTSITQDGSLAWARLLSAGAITASPVFSAKQNMVYTGTQEGVLWAMYADCNDNVAWTRQLLFGVTVAPVLDDAEAILYVVVSQQAVGNTRGAVYALNATDGTPLWTYPYEPPNPNGEL